MYIQIALILKVTLDTPMENSGKTATTRAEIAAMRRSYGEIGLETLSTDPIEAFTEWLHEAAANPIIVEANAMVLSTLGVGEKISSRTVLLKDISDGGFTFFTNYSSRKAHAIELLQKR